MLTFKYYLFYSIINIEMQGIDIKKVKCANCNLHDNLYKHDHKWLCMKCLALYFPKKKCNECKKTITIIYDY